MDTDDFLNKLLSQEVNTVMQMMVSTFGLWIKKHNVDVTGTQDAANVRGLLEERIDRVIDSKSHQRRKLPIFHKVERFSWPNVDRLTNKLLTNMENMDFEKGVNFLGNIVGAWMLSCPKSTVMELNGMIQIRSPADEAELIRVLRLVSHRSLLY